MNKALAFSIRAVLLLAACALLASCGQSDRVPEISGLPLLEGGGENLQGQFLADAPLILEKPVSQGKEDLPEEAPSYADEKQSEETSLSSGPAPGAGPISASWPAPQPQPPAPESQSREPDNAPREAEPPQGGVFDRSGGEMDGSGPIDAILFEKELLRLINEERTRQGIEPLGLEESMSWAAQIRAQEVLTSLSHTRPDSTPYYTAYDEAGFTYAGKWHGENVSAMYFDEDIYNSKTAAAVMFEELRSSIGHYTNMLSQNFSQVGIGAFVQHADGIVRIGSAQLFASF